MTSAHDGVLRRPLHTDLVTISEAADLTGRDRSTIKRDREEGRYPCAVKDPSGAWRIPVGDLVAAGRLPSGSVDNAREEIAAAREHRETRQRREALIRLEAQLAASDALIAKLRAERLAGQLPSDGLRHAHRAPAGPVADAGSRPAHQRGVRHPRAARGGQRARSARGRRHPRAGREAHARP